MKTLVCAAAVAVAVGLWWDKGSSSTGSIATANAESSSTTPTKTRLTRRRRTQNDILSSPPNYFSRSTWSSNSESNNMILMEDSGRHDADPTVQTWTDPTPNTWSSNDGSSSSTSTSFNAENMILVEEGSRQDQANAEFSFSMMGTDLSFQTMVPTSAGSSVFDASLLNNLVEGWLTAVTPSDILLDPTTPQGLAYQYIQDLLATNSSSFLTDTSSRDDAQRRLYQHYALAVLYFSTSGANWTHHTGWLQFGNECEWTKVVCEESATVTTVSTQAPSITTEATSTSDNGPCDDFDEASSSSSTITTENASDGSSTEAALVVTRLLLDENNLVGTLPSELQLLTNMREFLGAANQLRGTLPTELSTSWLALDSLDIEDNALTGNPWPTLWAFANLRRLHVSDNPSLDRSTFGANENENATLSFSFSTQLQELWMGNTNFAGTLPTELGLLTALESLYVFDNALTGTLPSQLGLLANLKGLLAHGNQLQGSIPTQLFGSDDDSSQAALPLVRLRLDDNQLSGSLSSSMAALAPTVRELRLDNNALTGPVPVELWQLNQLELLSLANNTLQGSIPDEAFVEFASLDTLDLSNNELSGSIPVSLFAIPSIRLVYLSHNAFTGSIPSNYGAATQLRDLYLDHNELQGSIPSIAAGQLANLTEFLLQDNAISSTMPDSVCDLIDSAMLEDLWADCAAAASPTSSIIEVNCTCCTQCVFLATE